MLEKVFEKAQEGDAVNAKQMHPVVSAAVGREVSLVYIFTLFAPASVAQGWAPACRAR